MMSPDQIVEQFQQIVATLKRIVEASSDLATRVDAVERNSGETLGTLTSIQGSVQLLLENYQAQSAHQNKLNESLSRRLTELEAKVAALSGDQAIM